MLKFLLKKPWKKMETKAKGVEWSWSDDWDVGRFNPGNSNYQAGGLGTWRKSKQPIYEENLFSDEDPLRRGMEEVLNAYPATAYNSFPERAGSTAFPQLFSSSSIRNPDGTARKLAVPHVAVSNSTNGALCKEVLDDMLSNFSSLYNDEDTADLCCSLNQEKVHVHKQFIKLYSEPLLNKILRDNQITKI
jgi:hypothetical protein